MPWGEDGRLDRVPGDCDGRPHYGAEMGQGGIGAGYRQPGFFEDRQSMAQGGCDGEFREQSLER